MMKKKPTLFIDGLNRSIGHDFNRQSIETERDAAVAQVGELSRELEDVHAALIVSGRPYVPPLKDHAKRIMDERNEAVAFIRSFHAACTEELDKAEGSDLIRFIYYEGGWEDVSSNFLSSLDAGEAVVGLVEPLVAALDKIADIIEAVFDNRTSTTLARLRQHKLARVKQELKGE